MLDTSAIIDFIKGDKNLAEIVKSAEGRGEVIAVASVSLFELLTPTSTGKCQRRNRY